MLRLFADLRRIADRPSHTANAIIQEPRHIGQMLLQISNAGFNRAGFLISCLAHCKHRRPCLWLRGRERLQRNQRQLR